MSRIISLLGIFALLLAGCTQPDLEPQETADSHIRPAVQLAPNQALDSRLSYPQGFRQLGILYDSALSGIDYRPVFADGTQGPWGSVEVTWSEAEHHVARVMFDRVVVAVDLKSQAEITYGAVEFYENVQGSKVLTRDLPVSEVAFVPNGLAPASLVISRAEWGARNPAKICGNVVDPYRMSIHHTAGPGTGDSTARMRQIQAYHIDTNGWCDVGYHFVVSAGGEIFQGRSDETRPGAHVGNQNSGNVGVSLMGNFENTVPPAAQIDATVAIVSWVASTYSIPLTRDSVRGHQEWPGQATACPGKNLLSRIDDILARAAGDEPAPVEDVSVQLTASVLSTLDNPYQDGTSADVSDVFSGDEFEVEIRIKNDTDAALRGVKLGIWVDSPYVESLEYRIESDAPTKDGVTFGLNDSNDAPENPENLTADDSLTLYAFGAGETKRVVVKLRASLYSVGALDHAGVRAWIEGIDDVYAQESYEAQPTLNLTNTELRTFVGVDVLSQAAWLFRGVESETEGWTVCADGTDELKLSGQALAVRGSELCIESPAWTSVDAAEFDALALRFGENFDFFSMQVFWAREGDDAFSGGVAYAPSGHRELVVNLKSDPTWMGSMNSIRLVFNGANTMDIDTLHFQTLGGPGTSGKEFIDAVPSEPDLLEEGGDSTTRHTTSGCSSTGADASLWPLVLLGLAGLRRRH